MNKIFTVIEGLNARDRYLKCIQKKFEYIMMWHRQYYQCTLQVQRTYDKQSDLDQRELSKMIFSGIKYINALADLESEKSQLKDYGIDYPFKCEQLLKTMNTILISIGGLTVNSLVQTFPITKEYDGEKWLCKDYFFTMNVLSEMKWDEPIGREAAFNLLFDYQNDDLRNFLCSYMCCLSDFQRQETGKGIAEQWCDELGIETYTYYKDSGIMVNHDTGKVTKTKKKSHLRVVK